MKDVFQLLFLCFTLLFFPYKRWITNNIITLLCRQYIVPVHTQGIATNNVFITLQWKWGDPLAHDFGSLQCHLKLGNPQRCLGDRYSKIIDFNPVKLVQRDHDWIHLSKSHLTLNLIISKIFQNTVFQLSEGQISFRQEISTTTSRVENMNRGKFFSELT